MNLQNFMSLISKNADAKAITRVLLNKNPQLQPLFSQMQASGKTEKDFVLDYCKQNNINIEPIISMFRGKGINL